MRRLRRVAACLAVGLGLAAGIAAAPANAAVAALQDDRIVNYVGPQLDQRLDFFASTGVKVTRVDVLWAQVAPTRPADPRNPNDPAYDWARYDQIFRGLAARGIVPIVDFYQTPPWASASKKLNAAPPPAQAGMFAGAIARRYSGTFLDSVGQPLPRVRRIEIWNEPNIDQYWSPQCRRGPKGGYVPVAARRYAALASAAAREIRAAQPDAIVVGGVAGPAGGTNDRSGARPKACPTGSESVSAMTIISQLRANRVRLDAWSQHLYPIGSPREAYFFPSWNSLPTLFTELDKLQRGLPVYVTETGYHTSYNRFHRYFVSETQQADWLEQTFQQANRYPRVEVAMWFNLQDNPYWTGGLYHNDLTPKPALQRYQALAASTPVPPDWRR